MAWASAQETLVLSVPGTGTRVLYAFICSFSRYLEVYRTIMSILQRMNQKCRKERLPAPNRTVKVLEKGSESRSPCAKALRFSLASGLLHTRITADFGFSLSAEDLPASKKAL